MSEEMILLTEEGMTSLRKELTELENIEMPELLKRLAIARAHGDLSENAEYHAVKEKKAEAVTRIDTLKSVLSRAEVFAPTASIANGTCIFGCNVKVSIEPENGKQSEREFKLVSSYEADSKANRLSTTSPLGKQLLGKTKGDVVELNVPAGQIIYTILSVSY